jgi:hypothetical protein
VAGVADFYRRGRKEGAKSRKDSRFKQAKNAKECVVEPSPRPWFDRLTMEARGRGRSMSAHLRRGRGCAKLMFCGVYGLGKLIVLLVRELIAK